MRDSGSINRGGFTLSEMLISMAISMVVIGAAMTAFVRGMLLWQQEQIVSELNLNLEIAMERVRADLRLSSIGVGLMTFYPSDTSEYTAISLPLSIDLNGDGLLDREADGSIQWNKTVVYHVATGDPDKLIRTEFGPRYPSAKPADFYSQLAKVVVAQTHANYLDACLPGESYSSKIIFENLVKLRFQPAQMQFDCYAPSRMKADPLNLGSLVLAQGNQLLKFTVVGKNALSSGYKLEIDRFRLGASGSSREGEIFTPINTHPASPYYSYIASDGTVSAADMSAVAPFWSGRSELIFNGNKAGASITFNVFNDLWCDSNFNEPRAEFTSNCSVKVDHSFASLPPYIPDIVVSMDKGTAWTASSCGRPGPDAVYTSLTTIVNYIYGSRTNEESNINLNGCWARLHFQRAPGDAMYIDHPVLTDLATGAKADAKFNKSESILVPADGPLTIATDWIPMWEIRRDRNYSVGFTTDRKSGFIGINGFATWVNTNGPMLSLQKGVPHKTLVGLSHIEVGYPKKAVYRSGVYDTQVASPKFLRLNWTHVERFSEGGDVDVRVRSGNLPDASDGNWQDARWFDQGYFQGNSGNDLSTLPRNRYVQYEALFECGAGGSIPGAHTNTATAVLRDLTIDWQPPPGLVDLQVDFAKGPDSGIVEARVNGKPLVKGVEVEMEIFKQGRTGINKAKGIMEIRPINTGR